MQIWLIGIGAAFQYLIGDWIRGSAVTYPLHQGE
jgi:hypothetical protein